jgi:hypothetical protein
MNTLMSVGSVIGAVLFWLIGVPLAAYALWRAVVGTWNLMLALIEFVCELIGAVLILAWQPLGWAMVWSGWIWGWVKRTRAAKVVA